MKAEEAPLYVRTYDLTLYVSKRTTRFPKHQRFGMGARLDAAAFDLLEHVTLALFHIEGRESGLTLADHALTRLRLAARLARDLELLREKQCAFLRREMVEIGRMIGGWQRRIRVSHADPIG